MSLKAPVSNLRIGTKIMASFCLILGVMAVLCATARQKLNVLNKSVDYLALNVTPSPSHVGNMREAFAEQQGSLSSEALMFDKAALQASEVAYASASKDYGDDDAHYGVTIDAGPEADLYGGIRTGTSAGQALDAAGGLSRRAATLSSEVRTFLGSVRAA